MSAILSSKRSLLKASCQKIHATVIAPLKIKKVALVELAQSSYVCACIGCTVLKYFKWHCNLFPSLSDTPCGYSRCPCYAHYEFPEWDRLLGGVQIWTQYLLFRWPVKQYVILKGRFFKNRIKSCYQENASDCYDCYQLTFTHIQILEIQSIISLLKNNRWCYSASKGKVMNHFLLGFVNTDQFLMRTLYRYRGSPHKLLNWGNNEGSKRLPESVKVSDVLPDSI